MEDRPVKVLLVDDDEDEYILTRDWLAESEVRKFDLDWAVTYGTALEAMKQNQHDAYLVDYQLGEQNGLELLRVAIASGCKSPIIILTGRGNHEVDIKAMKYGAMDYLVKDEISAPLLGRALRYAIERQRTLEALRESEEQYALAVRGAKDGIWDWNLNTDEIYFSPQWQAIIGYTDNEIGNHPDEWFNRIHPEDIKQTKADLSDHLEGLTEHYENEHRLLHKDGSYLWILNRGLAVRDEKSGKPTRIAGSLTDITERKQTEQQLWYAAIHDQLTGLFNRRYFMQQLISAIASARRHKHPLSLCLCDLDNFKLINDTYGHHTGDEVLSGFGKLVRQELRTDDVAGRLGGDEFCFIFPHVSASNAVISIERLRRQLEKIAFNAEGDKTFSVTGAFGITDLAATEVNEKDLLRKADKALYRAKALGKNQIVVNTA
jgi:diguanylate cyclase (GGDEF)-like protein/PAS domain S-box-containing protein